jgi:hypothetical protein
VAAEAAQKRQEWAVERERQASPRWWTDAIWTAAMAVDAHPYLAEPRGGGDSRADTATAQGGRMLTVLDLGA